MGHFLCSWHTTDTTTFGFLLAFPCTIGFIMKFRQSSVVAWIVGVVLLCDAVSAIGTHYKSDRSQLLKEEYEPTFQNSSYFDNAEFALSSRERHFRQSKCMSRAGFSNYLQPVIPI